MSNIYAQQCCLTRIACQNCGIEFLVAFSQGSYADYDLAALVKERALHYGDPPNMDCCGVGSVMNSIPLRVEQFWRRQTGNWERLSELEGFTITPDWALEDDYSTSAALLPGKLGPVRRRGEQAS